MPTPPQVDILMASFQGSRYLTAQLDSIAAQDYTSWRLWVSDDGSDDETLRILEHYQKAWGEERLVILTGPKLGCTRNFLSLVNHADLCGDFLAYADQDDIWDSDKLTRAVKSILTLDRNKPSLYCGRTRLVSSDGSEITGLSPLFSRPPAFKNAIVQSIAGGNTMLFNQQTKKLLQIAGSDIAIPSHDWWTYLAVTACGGTVVYDPLPSICYRQHENNIIGGNDSLSSRLERAQYYLEGRFSEWTDLNLLALEKLSDFITTENLNTLHKFKSARQGSFIQRVVQLYKLGLYRQTFFGNVSYFSAIILNRI